MRQAPADRRALVAIDLGAESCRVSLLRWLDGAPQIQVAHRFSNGPVERAGGLHWEMERILRELEIGLRRCAEIATEGVRSVGVDGWAVDYVRLDATGKMAGEPFCYRDARNVAAEHALHKIISAERMRALTGIQLMALNTAYQHFADAPDVRMLPWLNLPEYVLYWLGGQRVAEFTNATHTQMVGLDGRWSAEIFETIGEDVANAPTIVPPGTDVGTLDGPLQELQAFRATRLIAPCCHDTASAIAAVPDPGDDWAYISSGTWSLVGTLVDWPINSVEARHANFTNLGGADGKICFHKNVNGMWLLKQCLDAWKADGHALDIGSLVEASRGCDARSYVLNVDEADLLQPGQMPQRINAQLRRRGLPELGVGAEDAPEMASFLFHSLAALYAEVIEQLRRLTGKTLRRIYIFGGGSQNEYLNELTERATSLPVHRAGTEGSTLGSFAVQLASLEGGRAGEWAATLAP